MSIQTATTKFHALPDNVKGALMLMLAAGGFSVMTALIKIAGQSLHVTQILLVRQAIMVLIVSPTIFKNFPGVLRTTRPGLQAMRVVLAMIAMLLGFSAVIHMPLAEVTSIGFAKSFFITIFAILILKEPIGIRRWTAVIVGFIGVLIILRPGTESFTIYGVYALIAAACVGTVLVLIRLMAKTDRPTTILAYQALGVGVLMAAPGIWFWEPPTFNEWMLLAAIGVVSYCSQYVHIYAYKWGEASVMAGLDYVRLIYAILLGFLLFGNLPDLWTWVGAAIIILASLYTISREAKREQVLIRTPEGRGNAP